MGSSCSVGSTNIVADPSTTDPSSCPMPRPKEDGPPPHYEPTEPQPHTTTHNNNNTDTQPAACSKPTGVKSVAPPLAAKYHFPGYESAPVVCDKVIAVCEKSWTLLMTGETKPLQLMKANDRNSSPSIAFYDTFYQYLADKHPDTMLFFKNTNIQSRATSLAKMLSSGFNLAHQHGDKMHEMLTNISSSHAKLLKVNADHYTPVVMALMHTLETLFGEDAYTAEISSAWYHLYSLILNVMIPAAEEAYKHLPAAESSSAPDSSFPVPLSPPLSTAPAPLSPPALARPLEEVKDEVKEKKQEEEPAASTATTATTEEGPETHTTSEETKEAKEEKKEEVESTQQEEQAADSSNENKQVAEAPEQESEKEAEKEVEKEAEEAGKEEEKESQEDPVATESEQNLTQEAEHPAAVTAEETEEVQQDAQHDDAAPAASESAAEGEAVGASESA